MEDRLGRSTCTRLRLRVHTADCAAASSTTQPRLRPRPSKQAQLPRSLGHQYRQDHQRSHRIPAKYWVSVPGLATSDGWTHGHGYLAKLIAQRPAQVSTQRNATVTLLKGKERSTVNIIHFTWTTRLDLLSTNRLSN